MLRQYPCLVLEYTDICVLKKIFTAPDKSIVIFAWFYSEHTPDFIENRPLDYSVAESQILGIPLYVIPFPEVSHA